MFSDLLTFAPQERGHQKHSAITIFSDLSDNYPSKT
jgi:hypothetical protein